MGLDDSECYGIVWKFSVIKLSVSLGMWKDQIMLLRDELENAPTQF